MKTSKILSMLLALVMILALAIPMAASAANGTVTITAPSPNANVNGKAFRAFQVFTVETTSDGLGFVYTLNPAYAAFETAFGKGDLKTYIESLIDSTGAIKGTAEQAKLEELARALLNWSDANGITAVTVNGSGSTVSFPSLPAGYYVIAGTGVFGGNAAKTFAALCTVVDNKNTTVELKADAPSISKEVLNHNSSKSDQYEKWTDVNIGDTVTFRLTATIPNTELYTEYLYKVIDRMSAGLTYQSVVSVTAYKADTTSKNIDPVATDAADGYQFAGPTASGSDSVVTFTINSGTLMGLSAAGYKTIEIIYTAKLNSNAVIEGNGNPNYVKLQYSNDPNWVRPQPEETPSVPPHDFTPEDDAWVYTYKLNVFKYTGVDTALQGVKFQLKNAAGKFASFSFASGVYKFVAWVDSADSTCDLTTGADGYVRIVGIDAGTYTLKETYHLDGYNPVADISVKVYNKRLINDDMAALIADLNTNRGQNNTGDSWVDYLTFTKQPTVEVYNGTGVKFPGTGGIGTTIFVVAGLLIVGACAAAFVIYRKKSALSALDVK